MEKLEINTSRREFLAGALTLSGGLIVSFYLPPFMSKAFAEEAPKATMAYPPNAFIQIAPDNSITFVINKLEMGQGVNTSMAQLIAEELECDWKNIRSVSAPVNPVYNAVGMPFQLTGGSTALRTSWEQHRVIGATMREMLKTAAAKRWNVSVNDVKAENGFIINTKNNNKLSYGELAEEASKVPAPQNPPLKKSKDYKIIGKSMKRVDALEKSNGTAIFGIDVRIPGMLYAVVARPAVFDSKLTSYNEKAARAVKGVVNVVKFGNKVAVLATNTHAARMGRDALKAKWDFGKYAKTTSEDFMEEFKKSSSTKGLIAEDVGSVEKNMPLAKTVLDFQYEFPFLAHATMEPMNCTINYDGKTVEIWAGHQMPTGDRDTAMQVLGLPADKVNVHTVYGGGSFGRRASKNSDYVAEACALAKIVKKPLKITWTREDDMRGGSYRPMNFHKARVGLNEKGQIVAWDHHVIGQSILHGSPFEPFMVKNGLESTVTEGVTETPYKFQNFRCQQTIINSPITTLWFRSVGHTHTAFVMETMMDELAEEAGKDPFTFRRTYLKDPRHLAVLDLLEKQVKANLAKPQEGHAWGLALHESFASVVGQVAEISMQDGRPKVHRVFAAVHCGQVVNPEGAKTQVEGAIAFGLSTLWQKIQLKDGDIVQQNYDTYPVIRMIDMPEVHVDFVQTDVPPTGLGEPGVPPIAPAVVNAMYKLTKKRVRALPLSSNEKA